jgi:hypothetical protein
VARARPQLIIAEPTSREFFPKLNITLYNQEEILQKNSIPKVKKFFDCMDLQKCSKSSCSLWLNGLILDCTVCNASYHSICWPKKDLCDVCQLINKLSFNLSAPIIQNYSIFQK